VYIPIVTDWERLDRWEDILSDQSLTCREKWGVKLGGRWKRWVILEYLKVERN
jgi:hypothetical protein